MNKKEVIKELLENAKKRLKDGRLAGYFQALNDAVEVQIGATEEDAPDEFSLAFDKYDALMRKRKGGKKV